MFKDKKILIILAIAFLSILLQKLDFDFIVKQRLNQGQVEGISEIANNKLAVTFFDIGEADSIFITTPDKHKILIDGGEEDGQVLKKLTTKIASNNHYIDLVISTHPHADHLGGLIDILKNYQVGQVWLTGISHTSKTYLDFLDVLAQKNINTRLIYSCGHLVNNQNFTILNIDNLDNLDKTHCLDELKIDSQINLKILHPLENLKDKKIKNLNNSSIVLKMTYNQNSFLFMGDAEIPSEEKILATFPIKELKADVIKIAHQGSSDASSQKFLQAVQPTYAVILTGSDNSYGHPSLRIIRRLERLGVKILRTDQDGDIEFVTDGITLELK